MANNQNTPIRTEIVGGDKNFPPWTVYIDAQGNRTHVDIPVGSRAGSNVYRVDAGLNRIIDALKKADMGKDPVWPGRSAEILRGVDTSITAKADHSNPRLNTKTIEGSHEALAQLHDNLMDRGLHVPPRDRPSMVRGSTANISPSDMDHSGHKSGNAGSVGQHAHMHGGGGARGFGRIDLISGIAGTAALVMGLMTAGKAEASTPGFEKKDLGEKTAQVAERYARDNIPGAQTALDGNKASGAYQLGSNVVAGVVGGTVETGTNAIIKGVGGAHLTASFMAAAAMTAGMQGQKMSTVIVDALNAGKNAVGTVERYINGLNPFETGPGVTKQTSITPTTPSGPGAGPF